MEIPMQYLMVCELIMKEAQLYSPTALKVAWHVCLARLCGSWAVGNYGFKVEKNYTGLYRRPVIYIYIHL